MKIAFKNIDERRDDWLEFRKTHVGSSDIVTICRLNQYRSPLELWAEKTGKIAPQEDSPAMKYGRYVEAGILELYKDISKLPVERNKDTFVHPDYEWATATPDAFENGCPVEIKHTAIWKEWVNNGAPDYAHVQIMWQLGVIGSYSGKIVGLVAGRANDLKAIEFDFCKEIFEHCVAEAELFLECVEKDVPPMPKAGDKKLIDEIIQRDKNVSIILPEAFEMQLDVLEGVAAAKNKLQLALTELENHEEEVQSGLKLEMGNATRAALPDGRQIVLKEVCRKSYTVAETKYWMFGVKKQEQKLIGHSED